MAYCEQCAIYLRLLTDEQSAHKLTAETLAGLIRDNDKADKYRVERDQARRELADCRKGEPLF